MINCGDNPSIIGKFTGAIGTREPTNFAIFASESILNLGIPFREKFLKEGREDLLTIVRENLG